MPKAFKSFFLCHFSIFKKSEKKGLKALIFIKKGIIMVKSGEKWCELRWA